MAEGQDTGVGQALVPYTSAAALVVIPPQRLYVPSQGVPPGAINSALTNDNLAMSGASVQRTAYLQDNAFTRATDQILGTNLVQAAKTQAAVRQAQTAQENGAATTQAMVQDTHDAVSNVQSDMDANQAFNQQQYGFQSIDYATEVMWRYNDSNTFYNPIENMVINAAAGGGMIMSQILWRLFTSPNFLVLMNFCEASQGFPDVENLQAATPAGQGLQQAPLDYLNTVLPGYAWEDDHLGTGMTGMDFISTGDGITRSYFWSPPPPTLYEIFHLWDYTPSSGGPLRNGITDFMQIVSTLPFTY